MKLNEEQKKVLILIDGFYQSWQDLCTYAKDLGVTIKQPKNFNDVANTLPQATYELYLAWRGAWIGALNKLKLHEKTVLYLDSEDEEDQETKETMIRHCIEDVLEAGDLALTDQHIRIIKAMDVYQWIYNREACNDDDYPGMSAHWGRIFV